MTAKQSFRKLLASGKPGIVHHGHYKCGGNAITLRREHSKIMRLLKGSK
jgi:hypothetical protein